MPHLACLVLYPIKSLNGVVVTKATVLKSGALRRDREFAILDEHGKFVNGKRHPKVHLLRTSFDADLKTVSIKVEGKQTQVFHIDEERVGLEAWLSDYFGFRVQLQQNALSGFPDDTASPGPTVISTATLETVASWFPGLDVAEMRSRLRANVEIGNVPPFWEDQLFAEEGDIVHFQVGEVLFAGINPCQRCVVPTRHSLTGKVYPNFQKTFVEKRKESLPAWVASSRFNHFYRLSVNTRISELEVGKVLQIGDEVKILNFSNIKSELGLT